MGTVVVKTRKDSLLFLPLPSKLVYKQVKASQADHAETQEGLGVLLMASNPPAFRKQKHIFPSQRVLRGEGKAESEVSTAHAVGLPTVTGHQGSPLA